MKKIKNKSLKSTRNPQEADRLTREVESVDKSIDGLVASRELFPAGIKYG